MEIQKRYEMMRTERAKITEADVGFNEHGSFVSFITFVYRGSAQGFGYVIDGEFIKRFIRVCGVRKLSECVGRVVKVTHTSGDIKRIEPLKKKLGICFDVEKWTREARILGELKTVAIKYAEVHIETMGRKCDKCGKVSNYVDHNYCMRCGKKLPKVL